MRRDAESFLDFSIDICIAITIDWLRDERIGVWRWTDRETIGVVRPTFAEATAGRQAQHDTRGRTARLTGRFALPGGRTRGSASLPPKLMATQNSENGKTKPIVLRAGAC